MSKSCKKDLDKNFGAYGKFNYLYNTCNINQVLSKSRSELKDYNKSVINIISPIRLCDQKAPIRALEQFIKLRNEKYNFCWHVLGDGPLRNQMENMIKINDMNNCIKLYGNQNNPFPYIKKSDILLLPSEYEAAPMVYAESMVLGTPVITTKIISAQELIGKYGFICKNTGEGLYEQLKHILNNHNLIADKKNMLKSYIYDNEKIKKQFYRLINNDKHKN